MSLPLSRVRLLMSSAYLETEDILAALAFAARLSQVKRVLALAS